METPAPPWHLTGFAVALPEFGFRVRLLVNYHSSPVGPYLENAVLRLIWRGPTVTHMGVTSEATCKAGRELWGFPKTLETIGCFASPEGLDFWEGDPSAGGQTWHIARAREQVGFDAPYVAGRTWPLRLRFHTVQRRPGESEWIRVPGSVTGRYRWGRSGPWPALVITEFELTMEAGVPFRGKSAGP